MKWLTVPADLDFEHVPGTSKDSMPFADFFLEMLVPGLDLSRGKTDAAGSLAVKLDDCKPGEVIELTDSEYEALEKTLGALDGRRELPGRLRAKCIPAYGAIFEAKSKDPNPPSDDGTTPLTAPDADKATESETAN